MDYFDNIGMIIKGILYLSPREASQLPGDQVVFIDIRPEFETPGQRLDVSQIVYLPEKAIYDEYQMLDPANYFVVFDAVGIHSKEAVSFLMEHGFKHVASLAGGITDWERDGFAICYNKSERLTGSCACTLKPKSKFNTPYPSS